MQQLSGLDAAFIHAELDGMPQHVGGVSIYDPRTAPGKSVSFEQVVEMLANRVHLSPIFSRKLATVPLGLGQPYWVEDPDFDIANHVHHIALPGPGDWSQLCSLASRLHARPLSREQPLWEMYIIEGLNGIKGIPRGCFAMLLKVHHAAMDGATGPLFMNVMHDLSPEVQRHAAPTPRLGEQPSQLRMLGNVYLDALRLPLRSARFLGSLLPSLGRVRQGLREHEFEKAADSPRTRFQGVISGERVVNATRFDFGAVRAIKNAVPGATINDAMLAVVGGGLRRYLEHHGELPQRSLTTGCPIDVRDESEKTSGGNMIGLMTVALGSDIAGPMQRLRAIAGYSRDAKAYARALGPRLGVDVTDLVPGAVMAVALRTAAATGLTESSIMCNTVVTNVPGPSYQLYLCGAEMVDGFSLGPLMPNVGLFHVVYSSVQHKRGTLTLSITACPKMLPDSDFYLECLKQSFEELQSASGAGGAQRAGPRRSRRKSPAKSRRSGQSGSGRAG